jgi:SAM-dependent methyltransferase
MSRLVLSPDAVVRFKGGRAAVHNPYSPQAAVDTDDAAVVAFIARFAVPQDPFEAMRTLPAATRPVAENLLGQLVQKQVLIPADAPGAAAAPAEGSRGEVVVSLQVLSRTASGLIDDVMALGLDTGSEALPMSGLALPRRLFGVLAALDAIREEVKRVHAEVVSGQLRAVAAQYGATGLRLHIAHAAARVPGWVNLRSRPPADVALNPAWGLPFADGSSSRIFAMDALERLPLPEARGHFLRECRRVLGTGGRLRLVAPGAEAWDQLGRVLEECGFREVQRSAYMGSAHEELKLDEASGLDGASAGSRTYVEAVA